MTEKTVWSHLPNAVHIDRVVASVTTHPKEWEAAYIAGYNAAYNMARYIARYAAYDAARDIVYNAAYDAARYAARHAILALVAYDDCAHYLDMTSDKLRVWAILSEKPAAILLLPAVIAFEKISLLELA